MKTGILGWALRGAFAMTGLLLAAAPTWAAGTATLAGATTNTCSYTSITTLPNGDVTVTCSTTAPTTATISFGSVVGSLSTVMNSAATVPVNCAGACAGVQVGLAVSTTNVSLSAPSVSFTAAGTQSVFANGTAPLTAGSAPVTLTVTSIGSATSSTPALNGTLTTNVPIVDATTPGTLAFSPTAATATEGGAAVTVSVTRTGSGSAAGDVSVAYSCTALPTGYAPTFAPAASGTLSWVGADATAKTFTITPTTIPATTAGSVTCTLGAATGTPAPTVSTASYVLTVNKASTGGTCTTVADKEYDLSTGTLSRANVLMGGGHTAAIKIKAQLGTTTSFTGSATWPIPGYASPSSVQVNIAECPGDFTTSIAPICGPRYTTTGFSTRFSSLNRVESWYCDNLDPAKVYYINLRYITSAGASACATTTCSMYLDLQRE